jgi:hypothetical protein
MRVESYTVAHYGKDYLPWALSSVYDQVDKLHVVYTPHPSHGHATDARCPDSREEMFEAATSVGPKVRWHETDLFWQEGQHRDYALSLCRGDLALVVDCDEVWDAGVLEQALRMACDGDAHKWRVNFTTPWRSFGWVVRDPLQPDRIYDKRRGADAGHIGYVPPDLGPIWHFGYAVCDEVMAYKMLCHGHKGEWRDGWFEEKWSPWPPVDDVHPTCEGFWNPEPMDRETLPDVMRSHPWWDVEPIR